MSTDLPYDPVTGEILEDAQSPATNAAEFTVSEISGHLKRTLEDTFGYVRVRGELGRISRPASGHIYLDLKDDKAVLAGVVWRGNASRFRFQPEQGMEVIAQGKISTFAGQSKYQLIIDHLEPAGAGALMALLEERKKKLEAEGLFASERKQELPYLPEVIGVVTSPTGAVIRDILHRLADRFPRRVLVWPVRVQGETCAMEVAAGIAGFNAMEPDGDIPKPDLIIVARGGGSLEDLWGFNEEIVVRAAAESQIPLISAVGHETDWTLIDYAADWRAPTPTAAAERAVPVRSDLLAVLSELKARSDRALSRSVSDRKMRVLAAARALPRPDDVLALARQRFDGAAGRLVQALVANTRQYRHRYERVSARLSIRTLQQSGSQRRQAIDALMLRANRAVRVLLAVRQQQLDGAGKLYASLDPKNVLKRGYALVKNASGNLVIDPAQLKPGENIAIDMQKGSFAAVVSPKSDGSSKRPAKSLGEQEKKGGQGSLF